MSQGVTEERAGASRPWARSADVVASCACCGTPFAWHDRVKRCGAIVACSAGSCMAEALELQGAGR